MHPFSTGSGEGVETPAISGPERHRVIDSSATDIRVVNGLKKKEKETSMWRATTAITNITIA